MTIDAATTRLHDALTVWTDPAEVPAAFGPSAVALGMFDGVHRGHQRLLEITRERADALGVLAGAVTFSAHPMTVLAPHHAPAVLTDLPTRLRLLHEHGMSFVLVLPTTRATLGTPAAAFAADVLGGCLDARSVVVGADFRYGAGAAGSARTLAEHLAPDPVEVVVAPTVELGGERVSSTRIRGELAAGRTAAAGLLLGRPHALVGTTS